MCSPLSDTVHSFFKIKIKINRNELNRGAVLNESLFISLFPMAVSANTHEHIKSAQNPTQHTFYLVWHWLPEQILIPPLNLLIGDVICQYTAYCVILNYSVENKLTQNQTDKAADVYLSITETKHKRERR